jgi:putative chitobiose transport system permease protein
VTKAQLLRLFTAAARYAALALLVTLTIGPFLWLLSTALKGQAENLFASPPQLLPQQPTLANFARVFETQPFVRYFFNSAGVAALAVGLNLLLSSLAAYALARLQFVGRRLVFGVLLASMMLPFQLLLIPVYELALNLGLQNTRLGLVLPHACTAFGIFFMRQAFLSVPGALQDVALIEGVSHWRIWWHVMLPLVKPSLATAWRALFRWTGAWSRPAPWPLSCPSW